MNVLICCQYGAFCSQLVRRLKKERHEVYLLTGSDHGLTQKHIGVFQEYHFTYQNENITRIIQNVSPDVILIAGAVDPHFDWRDAQGQSVEYISGITNLLMAAKISGVKRVIYCSTLEIFEGNSEDEIMPDTRPVSISLQMRAMLQAETLCMQYRDENNFEVTILRLPEVYGEVSNDLRSGNFCVRMIDRMLRDQVVQYEEHRVHMMLYVNDAVDALIKVMDQNRTEKIYQISGQVCEEEEVAQVVREIENNAETSMQAIENSGKERSFPMDIAQTQEEQLHFQRRYSLTDGLKQLYQDCLRWKKKQEREKKSTPLKRILVALLETTGLFLIFFLLDWLVAGTWVTEAVDLYLIYVLIIGVTYGAGYALFASALSIIAKFFVVIQNIASMDSVLDYQFFLTVLQIVIIGVIVGLMRDKYKRKTMDLMDENHYLERELADITRINDSNLYVKNIYEKRLANYKNSLAKIYDITSQLDFMEPRKVTFQAARVAQQIMESDHVAIYVASRKSEYFRLAASTSARASGMGKSLHFNQNYYCYDSLINREIYLNREMDEKLPTYIGATYSGDRVDAIIMVWEENLNQVNLYQSNVMALLCRLIEKSMRRAALYEETLYNSAYIGKSKIMRFEAFRDKVRAYEEGARMGLLDYTLLEMNLVPGVSAEMVAPELERLVRDTDDIGNQGNSIYILLSNSNREEAGFALERLKKAGFFATIIDSKAIVGAEDD